MPQHARGPCGSHERLCSALGLAANGANGGLGMAWAVPPCGGSNNLGGRHCLGEAVLGKRLF